MTRAEELRGEAAALGDKKLPAYAVMVESTGERVREIKDANVCPHCGLLLAHGAVEEACPDRTEA